MNGADSKLLRPRGAAVLMMALLLGACASPRPAGGPAPAPAPGARGGGYYQDDGPGQGEPVDLAAIPDAVPRAEPLLARANRPYEVFGRRYVPMTRLEPYRSRGVATWYGRKYHGRQTSSGEVYDMYGMTAAHPTLPLPSYVRVTHLGNGRSVVVRVNDRGPFLSDRLIDLSWTAAAKLGYVQAGSAEVEVELLGVDEGPSTLALAPGSGSASAPAPAPAPRAAQGPAPTAGAAETAGAVSSPVLVGGDAADGPPVITLSSVAAAPAGGTPSVAAPTAVAPSPLGTTPAAPASSGHFLQFGALSSMDGAQALRARIARELGWLADRLQVRTEGGLFKVDAGPWPARDAALAAVERIRQESAYRPFAVAR